MEGTHLTRIKQGEFDPVEELDLDALGAAMRAYRKGEGLSQVQAADQLGVSKNWYQFIEYGQKAPSADKHLPAICHWMGRSVSDFYVQLETAA